MSEGNRLIAESELRVPFRASRNSLIKWRNAGMFDSDVRRRINGLAFGPLSHFYWDTTLDAFLREHAFGFGEHPIPTIVELLDNPNLLVTFTDAADVLGITSTPLGRLLKAGKLAYIRLTRSKILVTAESLAECVAERAGVDWLSPAQAARVLCIGRGLLDRMINAGHLAVKPNDGGRDTKILRTSVLDLLGEEGRLLPSFVDPEAWMTRRLSQSEEVLSVSDIDVKRNMDYGRVRDIVQSKQVPHIRTMGGNVLMLASDVDRYFRWSFDQIAELFDVPRGTVRSWVVSGFLCGGHQDRLPGQCPALDCLVAYVAANSNINDEAAAASWVATRMNGKVDLVSGEELADLLVGADIAQVEALWESGVLMGVRLPSYKGRRELRFLMTKVAAYIRLWERKLGGDYHRPIDVG
ncbi:MAG TPA: hypothetical protein VLA88_05800 [Candidatus Saccharimonadales bacterium]|nr:hypothetical protein [Candidatus Saccharimonadales bacterium]